MITRALGNFIRMKRVLLDIGQGELATHLGFSHVFMSRIESGDAKLPVKYAGKLAKKLKVKKKLVMTYLRKDYIYNMK